MKTPTDTISDLLEQCSPAHLARAIDEPIDTRFGTFKLQRGNVTSPRDICAATVKLLRHLDRDRYSRTTALMEASRLIDAVTTSEGGMAGAFLPIKDGTRGGLRRVLLLVVARIKEERRHLFVRGLLRVAIDPSDAQQRLRLAQALLAQRAPYFLWEAPTAEKLACRLEELVLVITETESHLNRCLVA